MLCQIFIVFKPNLIDRRTWFVIDNFYFLGTICSVLFSYNLALDPPNSKASSTQTKCIHDATIDTVLMQGPTNYMYIPFIQNTIEHER